MQDADSIERIRRMYQLLWPGLDERMRRQWAAAEARGLGRGGMSLVARATGLSRVTIGAGLAELDLPADERERQEKRIRRVGGGRRSLTETDPQLLPALEALIEPTTRGHPESALRWTSKSTRHLAEELTRQGHPIGRETVASLLKQSGYSLQAEQKMREGRSHPDRDGQFRHINDLVHARMDRDRPTISVDTKKKELLGDFANGGREWQPQGRPQKVRTHDFMDKTLGKAIPYGVYDILNNQGFVSVGVDHDTSEFAVHGIRRWWTQMGSRRFPKAADLLITADGGGSNSSRSRLWKTCLQQLADDLGFGMLVCHFPPGTSKWNKIEHRLFSFITQNWRGRPLMDRETIVELIASTKTDNGLCVEAELDASHYQTRIKVSDPELAAVRLVRNPFHGEWNYTIKPKR
jgi:hypothetical protein